MYIVNSLVIFGGSEICFFQRKKKEYKSANKVHTYSWVIGIMEALAGYLMCDNVQDNVHYFFLSCQIMAVSDGINSINASIFPAVFINFLFFLPLTI